MHSRPVGGRTRSTSNSSRRASNVKWFASSLGSGDNDGVAAARIRMDDELVLSSTTTHQGRIKLILVLIPETKEMARLAPAEELPPDRDSEAVLPST